MIHHEVIEAATAENEDEIGHWDVIEMSPRTFIVFDRFSGMTVAEFTTLNAAITDAQRRADKFDRAA